RLPAWHECVTVQTWFVRIEGAQFVREMRFCDAGGETLIEAQTLWITADPQSHRIIRPNNNFFKMQPVEGEKVDITAERVAALKQAPCVGRKEVRYSDLDCNRHLNNAVYADLICDFFPGGFFGREIDRLSIDFFGEALLGEIIEITAGEDARGRVVVSGNTDTHRCFGACVELRDGLGK
ncbi:MAG: thioesterase, partial [Clostridia bacterium]|nr:thioesterase [Clostridia bacterium]